MYTEKDISFRSIYVINCVKDRNLRVSTGELLLEDTCETGGTQKTLTKLPFQKILALFIVGHITITTPLIEKCKKYNVALVVMKPNFRPVFYWSQTAEANYLLRAKQYAFDVSSSDVAKALLYSKLSNQQKLLSNTRRKDPKTIQALEQCERGLDLLSTVSDVHVLLGIEGTVARVFFDAYFQDFDWIGRKPRTKRDPLNVTLDIGYTMLFNYVECFVRMFGFDPYIGVYHRLWFKRKSLICDLQEPFRAIIDRTVRTAFHRGQFQEKDFKQRNGEYYLIPSLNGKYMKVFFDSLIPYKTEIFRYIRDYYRAFMRGHPAEKYPRFKI